MKHAKLERMVKGWFVGAFQPSAFTTDACEVALKRYDAGASEAAHYHNKATEITLIVSGKVRMFNKAWIEGDIIVISPGESTAFEALTEAVTVVVKVPGALDDKFFM